MNVAAHEFIGVTGHCIAHMWNRNSIGQALPQIARRPFEATKHGTLNDYNTNPTQHEARCNIVPLRRIFYLMSATGGLLACAVEVHRNKDLSLFRLTVAIKLGLLNNPFLVGIVFRSLCHILEERPRDDSQEDASQRHCIHCYSADVARWAGLRSAAVSSV